MDRLSDWYALQVATGDEEAIARRIEAGGIRAVVPSRTMLEISGGKWRTAVKPLFPGYALVQCSMSPRNYYQLTNTPKVIRILGTPTTIHQDEMKRLLTDSGDGASWGPSQGHRADDGTLIIDSGPLADRPAQILSVDARRKRVKVEMDLWGETLTLELALELTKGSPDTESADTSPEPEKGE
jgi:transcriptional antiterminator NusG